MPITLKTILQSKVVALSIAIALLTVFLFFLGKNPTLYILEEQKLSNAPDFFLEGVSVSTFDTSGQLEETISADVANHFTLKSTEFEKPIIYRFNGTEHSIATAEKGLIKDSSNDFTLTNNAQIARYVNDLETARIESNSITYNTEQQTILGQGNSTLTTPQGRTHSEFIYFNLAESTANLKGGISGIYESSAP